MRVFTLAVFPSDPAQIPVLANNMTVQDKEERPHQIGTLVLPIPKGQVGQVHVIPRLHSYGSPCGHHLGRDFFIPAAAATTNLGGTPACWPPSCNEVGK